MEFPNLRRGINRIIIGEVMGVVSTILLGFASFMMALVSTALNYSSARILGTLAVVAAVVAFLSNLLTIISSVILGIGLLNAREDETKFKEAIIVIVISIVMLILQTVFENELEGIFIIITGLADMWVMVAVIQGFVNILDKLKDKKLAEYGIKLLKRTVLLSSITVLSNVTLDFFTVNASFAVIGVVFILFSTIAQIVNYKFYIGYLRKFKRLYFSNKV